MGERVNVTRLYVCTTIKYQSQKQSLSTTFSDGSALPVYSPGCQLSAGTSDFVTIWDLLVISASADPYIFRVISYQCPAQCLLLIVLSREALTHMYIRM